MSIGLRTMLSDTQIIATMHCPECRATPGNPCTYLKPRLQIKQPGIRSPYVAAAYARAGTPTKNPHNSRRRTSYWRLRDWLKANADIFTVKD